MLGAIEAKYIGCTLKDIKDIMQLKGHVLWFNKVLYTNGLDWQYYEYSPEKNSNLEQIHSSLYFWRKKDKYPWNSKDLSLLESQWNISLISENDDDNTIN